MGLIKVNRDGGTVYAMPLGRPMPRPAPTERCATDPADLPLDIRQAGMMLVIRAVPGSAHAIAAALDRVRWPEVVARSPATTRLFVAFSDAASLRRIKR